MGYYDPSGFAGTNVEYPNGEIVNDGNPDELPPKGKGKTKDKSKNKSKSKYIPKTGDWRALGKKKGQWIKENGYELKPRKQQGNNKGGAGQSISDVYDSSRNKVGRIDKGFKVDGKTVPEHFHSNSDTTNIHYYFSD